MGTLDDLLSKLTEKQAKEQDRFREGLAQLLFDMDYHEMNSHALAELVCKYYYIHPKDKYFGSD